ncbi:hypothetical protein BO83DRAFT_431112 [Aspergillus eucalypticola CBS 122712]|uniref:Uncharacterized protein n=1 Tax=Aspergillus eucalypticola (strain CBS 122712 / IBT 29274) TaxID=1448314 RepID=A0A317UST3_ASPEC|nr:uncharacterized protein BO83DRAFT_431112 [Aspergillus eucalypticola CBS 122712]PWY64419.1 hypothetical protein BO83DRAFT_431112 [Aspergillus eucalypticola CBS 122712]
MKLVLLIFMLVLSIDMAKCSRMTGPFEALYFYYAYQIDAAAAARAAEDGVSYEATIGGDCIGKDCTLEAFLETIMDPSYAEDLTPTSTGSTRSPDVYATAEEIDTYWNYNSDDLQADEIIKKAPSGFANLVNAVANKIQEARAVVPSADLVEKATVSLKWAQAVRLTEMVVRYGELEGAKANAFAEKYPKINLQSTQRVLDEDRTVSPSLKMVYTDLDYAGMATEAAGGDQAKLVDTYKEFLNFAEAKPTESVYRIHQNIVNMYQRVIPSLEAGCS